MPRDTTVQMLIFLTLTCVGCGVPHNNRLSSEELDFLFPELTVKNTTEARQIPSVPIVVDGIKHPPEYIKTFEGRPLDFLVDRQALEEGFLHVFPNVEGLKAHIRALEANRSEDVTPLIETRSVFNEHAYHSGETLIFSPGTEVPSLAAYSLNWFYSWNDKISSVNGATYSYTILYSDKWFVGERFVVAPGADIVNLQWHAFDDKTSSLRVY